MRKGMLLAVSQYEPGSRVRSTIGASGGDRADIKDAQAWEGYLKDFAPKGAQSVAGELPDALRALFLCGFLSQELGVGEVAWHGKNLWQAVLADFFVDCFVGFLHGVLGFQKSQFCLKISSKGLMNADKPIKYVIKQAFFIWIICR